MSKNESSTFLSDGDYKHRKVHFYDESSEGRLCCSTSHKYTDDNYQVTCLACIALMQEKGLPLQWDTSFIIEKALSSQDAARHLNQHSQFSFTEVTPILLAYSLELTLKAFFCHERPGPPPPIHDLFSLFTSLNPSTITILNADFLKLHPSLGIRSNHIPQGLSDINQFHRIYTTTPIHSILEPHRNLFNEWRYPFKPFHRSVNIQNLNLLLTFLIETFHRGWPAQKSSFNFPPE